MRRWIIAAVLGTAMLGGLFTPSTAEARWYRGPRWGVSFGPGIGVWGGGYGYGYRPYYGGSYYRPYSGGYYGGYYGSPYYYGW